MEKAFEVPVQVTYIHNSQVVNILTLNPSLDISYVIKNFKQKEKSNLENVLLELISEPDFKNRLQDYLIEKRMAGNMFIIARNIQK